MAVTTTPAPRHRSDRNLKRELGLWHLTAASFSGVIGSGWLVGAYYAAQSAGPASLITWVVGGVAFLIIALVMADLGATRPESGALVRWPARTHGGLAATVVGWGVWIAYATNPPSESAVVLQYASQHVSGLYSSANSRLTALGTVVALALMAVFVLLNWFGILLLGRVTTAVSTLKWIVPAVTLVVLLATSRHGSNFTAHGGFAPDGYAAPLSAISTAGIIYAYTGFQSPLDLSGEARDPHRDVPRAIILGLALSTVLYIGLQIAFITALPNSELAHGWSGLDFTSPFAQLATVLNLGWLSWVLYGDAILSPSGSALVFTATITREAHGMSKNRSLPRWFTRVDRGSGVPRRALLLNYLIGAVFLLLLPSWHSIIAATSELGLFVYSVTMICHGAFRAADPAHGGADTLWRKTVALVLAPTGFVVASLILYWAKWTNLRIALPLLLIALAVYAWNAWQGRARRARTEARAQAVGGVRAETGEDYQGVGSGGRAGLLADLRAGGWLCAYLVAVFLMSWLGGFGGRGDIAKPWDSVIVAAIGLAAYLWGLAEARRYMGSPIARARDEADLVSDDDEDGTGTGTGDGDAGGGPAAAQPAAG